MSKHFHALAAFKVNGEWEPVGYWSDAPPTHPFLPDNRPPAHVWRSIRKSVFERDDYRCTYCGERGRKLECDHIVPVSRGGSNDLSNLTTACRACNRAKRNKLPGEWSASRALSAGGAP